MIGNENGETVEYKKKSITQEDSNRPLEVNFIESDFTNGFFIINHNKNYIPQVSVLNEKGEKVTVGTRITDKEVEINSSEVFRGKVIIT